MLAQSGCEGPCMLLCVAARAVFKLRQRLAPFFSLGPASAALPCAQGVRPHTSSPWPEPLPLAPSPRHCRLAAEILRTNAAEHEVQRIKAKFGKKLWDVGEEHQQQVRGLMGGGGGGVEG